MFKTIRRWLFGNWFAILKFDDKDQLTMALRGADYYGVLWDLDQKLRGYIKHSELSEDVETAYEELREYLHDNIDFNEVH